MDSKALNVYALGSGFTTDEQGDEGPPEIVRPLGSRNRFVVPTKVLAAVPAEGHAPPISRKPSMGSGGLSEGDSAGTGIKGVKIALHT